MGTRLIQFFLAIIFSCPVWAQKNCGSFSYQQQQLASDPSLAARVQAIETFTREYSAASSRETQSIIKIPVVVHLLYHQSGENISDAEVQSQIAALNRDYRRRAADTINTPAVFRPFAADCEIEFQLAISDPRRRSTTGIIRKYTPVTAWNADDKMKFSSETGDDAWDPKSYLNIWVCNLDRLAGYSSLPGGPENKDGVVIDFSAFVTIHPMVSGYDLGRTTVHEVGHWLNLKHLWGDTDCGDDLVDDTPKQLGYNIDCPSGIRITCGNGPNGDMYMNYMDFTNDACMNLFTIGQKNRMRALFASGGLRNSLLTSTGLSTPLFFESPVPDTPPKWLHPQLFPNPTTSEMTLDLAYDVRWIGRMIHITNLQGQTVMQIIITSKTQTINVTRLQPGMYFLNAEKDGELIKQKFIKL